MLVYCVDDYVRVKEVSLYLLYTIATFCNGIDIHSMHECLKLHTYIASYSYIHTYIYAQHMNVLNIATYVCTHKCTFTKLNVTV